MFSKRTLIAMAIAAGIVGLATLGVFLPQQHRLRKISARTDVQKRKLDGNAQQATVVPELAAEVDEMKGRFTDFDQRLPKKKELGGFLREISEYLTAANLTDQVIEPGQPTQSGLVHTLPIMMTFRGSFLDTGRFLNRLEGMQRLTRIERLSILRTRGEGDLETELLINIYFTES